MKHYDKNNKINILVKKYNIEPFKIKSDQLQYYYTNEERLCCDYKLEPIRFDEVVGPFEYKKAIKLLMNYYQDIQSSYYQDLYAYMQTNGETFKLRETTLPKEDSIIKEFIKFREKTFILTIWPHVIEDLLKDGGLIDFLKKFGTVYYLKKIKLSYNACQNLIYQLYSDTNRFQTIKKIREKMEYLKWGESFNTIRVIVFENNSNENISGSQAQLKTKIRDFLLKTQTDKTLRGDDLVHINDNFYQTVEYSKIFFHKKTRDFLQNQNLSRYLSDDFKNCRMYHNTFKKFIIDNFKLVDHDRFLLFGSSVLNVYGIRQCRDVDGLVSGVPKISQSKDFINKAAHYLSDKKTKFFFASLGITFSEHWKQEWDIKDIEWFKIIKIKQRDQMIFDPYLHFYFNGIKLSILKVEMARKYIRRKYFDFGDIIEMMDLTGITMKFPPLPDDPDFLGKVRDYLLEKYKVDKTKADNLIKTYIMNSKV